MLPAEEGRCFRLVALERFVLGVPAEPPARPVRDVADERRILQTLVEARTNEYNTVAKVCSRFLVKAMTVVETQSWNDQLYAEFAEVLEKVHVLFRTAKRHDLLGSLTATKRADAAESLSVCEQVFRVLVEQDYTRARRLLEMYRDLLSTSRDTEPGASDPSLVGREPE